MGLIEDLMQGIERTPNRIESKRLSRAEMIEADRNEVAIIKKAIAKSKKQFDLVNARKEKVLELYDSNTLGGYSPEKDAAYAAERKGVCIPCFIRFPADRPAWIRLNWGLSHLAQQEETQYGILLDAALAIRDEEASRFHYALRASFVTGVDAARDYYGRVAPLRLVKPKSLSLDNISKDDNSEPTPAECNFFETMEMKRRLLGGMNFSAIQYQFMLDLVKAKQK